MLIRADGDGGHCDKQRLAGDRAAESDDAMDAHRDRPGKSGP